MKTGLVVALVAVPVIGLGAFLLLRKKAFGADRGNRDLAAMQMTAGPAVVAKTGIQHFNPTAAPPSVAGLSGGAPGGGFSLTGVATGIAGKYANSIIPGSGALVGTAATAAGSLLKKIPGLGSLGSKLKFW